MKRALPARIAARYAEGVVPQGTRVLAGRYRLISPLREGGMGKVWTAEHLSLHSVVAIKLLDDELSTRPEAVARFQREARAAAQIRSPHIVQVFDVGIEDGIPFLAMELLQGESLAERLERVTCLSPADTARFLNQVARGIARAHGVGLVHRDLKPDNVFLERNDDEELAKVLDFGVAKALLPGFDSESGATRTGALIGSPHYMSPEQTEASATLDHRTDIWSFGVMAFECLTGMKPFNQASLGSQVLAICAWPLPVPSHVARVPSGFDAWFAKACSRSPSGRFRSIQEAAQALSQVCQATPQDARPDLHATLPGTGPSTTNPRSDSLRTVAPVSSLPPRLRLSKLSKRTTLLSASAVLLLLVSTLLVWRLTRSAPDVDTTAKAPPSTAVSEPKSEPVESAKQTPKVGSGAAVDTTVPLAPTPESSPTQLRSSPRAAKALPAKLAPKRNTRSVVDLKEDPY